MLVAPEIATNTGNIIRLCANVGARLHLVEPLGFTLDDRRLRRAGLDYHELADVQCHPDLDSALAGSIGRCFAFSSQGTGTYHEVSFGLGDVLVFGAERAGLDAGSLSRFDRAHLLRLPMRPGNRSLNLANAVAIVTYEAWRQNGFAGAADPLTPTTGSGLTGEEPSGPPFDS